MPDLREDVLLHYWDSYYRLQHRRDTFDQVAKLSVEGLNKSAIARVESISWNTVDRWLEKPATAVATSTTKVDGVQGNRASSRRDSNYPPP